MIKTRFIWSFIVPILLPLVVFAYVSPGKPTGFVNDFAGVLKETERQQMETKLAAFEKNTGNEIAVVIIPDLGGDTIENFSVELFKEWGIGKKSKDNGILLLVARDDRKVRIEVGYGLEGSLTDAQSSWILKNIIVPAFRENNFYGGIDGAVDKIMAAVNGENIPEDVSGQNGGSDKNYFNIAFFVLFCLMWLTSILGRSKSWWLGGILGGVAGIIIGLIKGFLYAGLLGIGILIPLGLLFDFLVSRAYGKAKTEGRRPPWWIGGRGFGGSGRSGFGGFGGGSSGGGGSSSSW